MSFASDIAKFNIKVEKRAVDSFQRIAFGLSGEVVNNTPFGRPELWQNPVPPVGYVPGSLKAGWNAGKNKIPLKDYDHKDKSGRTTLRRILHQIEGLKLGDTFYLVNMEPYARRVEYGWSHKQAPEGMVRKALAQYRQIVRREAVR